VLNPTNPEHKAAAWEEDIIQYFRNYEDVKEYSGVRSTPTGQYLFLSSPFKITNEACLVCHSTAAAAPASMVKKYGSHNGFGWKHNEIVGAQIVNVPMAIPIARADATFSAFMIILGGVFATIWIVLNVFLHFIIIKRVNKIASKSEEISKGNMTVDEFDQSGKDELSSLGHSFNLMYRSLTSAVKLLDKSQA
jgi:methyl-accepting chemotaxis protein